MAVFGAGVVCLPGVRYTMLADAWVEHQNYDEVTGETHHSWKYEKTIKCISYPYVEGGIRGMGSVETFDEYYKNMDYIRIKSQAVLSKRYRLTNVRNKNTGQVLWTEDEGDGSPTVFTVDGTAPISHPITGNIIEWVISLSRASVRK